MAGNTSKIELISNALILIGDAPISSLSDPGAGAIAAANLYDSTYRNMLSIHRWRFAVKTARLSRLVAEPDTGFQYQFQLPTDHLYLIRVKSGVNRGSTRDFEIYEDKLHTNRSDVYIDYIYLVAEDKLPAWFAKAMEFHLASLLAIPVTGNSTRADYYRAQYEMQLKRAKHADASERPNVEIEDKPFIDVRF